MSGHAAVTVSRVEYEKSIQHLVESAKTCASSILQDLSLMPTDIHEVVLVGGATRTPAVRAMLLSLFETSPSGAIRELCVSVDADEAVAQGLAIQGAILSGVDHSILQVYSAVTAISFPTHRVISSNCETGYADDGCSATERWLAHRYRVVRYRDTKEFCDPV